MASSTLVVIGSVSVREYTLVRDAMRNSRSGPAVIRVSDEQVNRFIEAYREIDPSSNAPGENSVGRIVRSILIGTMGIPNPLNVQRLVLSQTMFRRLHSVTSLFSREINLPGRLTLLDDIYHVFGHCHHVYVMKNGRPELIKPAGD